MAVLLRVVLPVTASPLGNLLCRALPVAKAQTSHQHQQECPLGNLLRRALLVAKAQTSRQTCLQDPHRQDSWTLVGRSPIDPIA